MERLTLTEMAAMLKTSPEHLEEVSRQCQWVEKDIYFATERDAAGELVFVIGSFSH